MTGCEAAAGGRPQPQHQKPTPRPRTLSLISAHFQHLWGACCGLVMTAGARGDKGDKMFTSSFSHSIDTSRDVYVHS